ncbi:hypothetical protein [Pelosinus fermentans]|uniref:(Uracil-5)-methyltransferase n=1 Tax=Pelosinus fermentans JBW45 TaxID=1192197 RepID=I8TT26_9FIRM|nr:hypothetical protein JBW_03631 [Pelosinus fermentans JBW45]
MTPKRIVYVSCNPASLARDIAILSEFGYVAKEIQPVDMFSETSKVHKLCFVRRDFALGNAVVLEDLDYKREVLDRVVNHSILTSC